MALLDVLLNVQQVTHRLGADTVLHDVTFAVDGPALVILAGRSGSGKSTLCHLIGGLGTPSAGQIQVASRPAADVADWGMVSLLPQRLALAEELTIAENVQLPAMLRRSGTGTHRGRADRADRADRHRADAPDLLVALDLAEVAGRLAGQASLGEQQRAALARALILRPQLAVLDEPTGHQDDEHVDQVLSTLIAARDAGTAILVATHDDRVLEIADQIIRLDRGRIVAAD